MKSLMVVSQRNDPFYIDYDGEFAKYIIDRAKSAGLIMEENIDITELDANLVMQLFSPLVLSQWLLIDQTKEPCSSILCPNGFMFVFKQTDELLVIAINGDGTESEAFLHRKIQAFMMIMRFIFGPAGEEIGQSQMYSKKSKWDFLHQLMQNWSDLVHSEQAFLVEAVERVHVNQMLNEKCMEILLKSIKQFQAARDQSPHHALLLVNSKLLALYSNRSAYELRPKDLLMAMVLSKTLYPQADRLEDLFSKFYISTKSQHEPSFADDNSDAGDDEYHSAPNTPRSNRSQSLTSVHKSETVRNMDSSDKYSQSEKSVEKLSLLDMFKEKCPDVNFEKECNIQDDKLSVKDEQFTEKEEDKLSVKDEQFTEKEEDELSVKDEQFTEKEEDELSLKDEQFTEKEEDELSLKDEQFTEKKQAGREIEDNSQIISVEAVIDRVADMSNETLGLDASFTHITPESVCVLDSDLQNGRNLKTASSENLMTAEEVKHDSSSNQSTETHFNNLVSSETVEERSLDKTESFAGERNVLLSSVQKGEEEVFKMEDKPVVGRSSRIAVPNSLPLIVEHRNLQSQLGDGSTVGTSSRTIANTSVQPLSSDQKHNGNLSLNENLMHRDVPATNRSVFSAGTSGSSRSSSANQSRGSRTSTPSQQSQEPEIISRTSSGATVNQSEDLIKAAMTPKRVKETMESPKPGSLLHTDAPVTTKSTTESLSVTPETGSSLSAYSSSIRTSDDYLPQTIFLETSTCLYSPYNLYTVQISPGLTLILLSQASRHSLADSLYQVIQTIQDIIYGRRSKLPRSRSTYVYDTINVQLGRVYNSLKKTKGLVNNLSYDILKRWDKEDLKSKLLDLLERDSSFRIPLELESPLIELYKKLRDLFSQLFLSPLPHTSQLRDTLAQIRDHIRAELLDYREYLNVKAQRNITMTSYIDEFPGLMHFIFIDRHFHQMTAPSLNISLKAGERTDATSYLKEKIWTMYQHMMSKLTDGYTTVIMRDGDFYFSYFLWFEDYMGNPLPVQESYKPLRKQPYPGILCGQFYKDLLQSCFPHAIQGSIHCNEMFLMHLGTVHPMYIADHCRKLAYKMWEMSGEIHHSVNLL